MANTTWNPADLSGVTLTGGNLIATTGSPSSGVRAVDKQAAGKFYFEAQLNTAGSTWDFGVGIVAKTAPLSLGNNTGQAGPFVGMTRTGGNLFVNTTSTVVFSAAITTGTTLCVAVDLTNRLIWFRQGASGFWNNNASYSPGGAGGLRYPLGPINWYPFAGFAGVTSGANVVANFGDTAFVGAVPSTFTAGWTAGANPPNVAAATQVTSEQWINANADARMTQIFLEHWGPAGTSQPQAVATLVALEQWMAVGAPVTAQARAWILA